MNWLYTGAECQQLDQLAIAEFGIHSFDLMCRAGQAAFDLACKRWPDARRWLICCGSGNNAGDGYIVASLAKQAGFDVRIIALQSQLTGDAALARDKAKAAGVAQLSLNDANDCFSWAGIIVDALLGTGARGPARPAYAEMIERINNAPAPTMALDVPSGIDAEQGAVPGPAVVADITLTFIGRKFCLHTGPVLDTCGEVHFDSLNVPERLYQRLPGLPWLHFDPTAWPGRKPNHYKHRSGHLLVVGGDHGMGGAPLLACQAALRSGAGLVSMLTRAVHIAPALARCPEIMVADADDMMQREALMSRADAMVVGPGLGRQAWGRALLEQCLASEKPLLIDADALHLLPELLKVPRSNLVLTPHTGEAAALLGSTSASVANDRLGSVRQLVSQYGGAAVLKGAGTLIADTLGVGVCAHGNPGMASAGMGDLLCGCIGARLATLPPGQAARDGVLLHSAAGDKAAQRLGQTGLMATDLLPEIAQLLRLR